MKELDLQNENTGKLFLAYAVPAIIGVAVFSLYSLVDGIFVSRFCGAQALSAVEICAPVLSVFSCISVVAGVGGNTLIGISIGENNYDEAKSIFSLTSALIFACSAVFVVIVSLLTRQLAVLLGADQTVIDYVCDYLSVCGYFAPAFLISGFWALCMETMGKPVLAMLGETVTAFGNIALDYVLIVKMNMGVKGAALASALSAVLAVIIYAVAIFSKKSSLGFCRFKLDKRLIGQMLYNGLSEGISAVSTGIISYIYNIVIMKASGSKTLASFSITLTIISFLGSVLIGASQGISPIVSVNYGAKKYDRIKQAIKVFLIGELILSVMVSALFVILHSGLIQLFRAENAALSWNIGRAYIPSLILTPINVIIISYFTAINDAKTSALLSLLRALMVRALIVCTGYLLFGINAVWYSAAISELIVMIICICTYQKKQVTK